MAWQQDDAHTTVGFSARHMMFTTVRGRFTSARTAIDFDPQAPECSRADVEIDAASVTTGDEKRDGHLRSADFFDAENHPRITFRSGRIESRGGGKYLIHGDLTIRGTTKPVALDGELGGVGKAPWGATVAGLVISGSIDRRDWGLVWNVPLEGSGLLVSEKVRLEIELELVDKGAAAAA